MDPAATYQRIQEIEEWLATCSEDDQQDLVLIYCQVAERGFSLVYHRSQLPASPSLTLPPADRLDDLRVTPPQQFVKADLFIGLPGVQLLLPSIPSYGPAFLNLDNLYQRRLAHLMPNVRASIRRLAERLHANLPERPSDRNEEAHWLQQVGRIFQLALPDLLWGRDLEQLVAVRFESPATPGAAAGLAIAELYYNDEEAARDLVGARFSETQAPWIALIDEVKLLNPTFGSAYCFLDLRVALRRMGVDARNSLGRTLTRLAQRLLRAAQKAGHEQLWQASQDLTAEAMITESDVDDLIALIPAEDQQRFVEQHSALQVTRTPVIAKHAHGPETLLVSLQDLSAQPGKYRDFRGAPYSFVPFAPALARMKGPPSRDLATLMQKAGRSVDLARTYWLTSRDLELRPRAPRQFDEGRDTAERRSPSVWDQLYLDPEVAIDLARRAAWLYSLQEPWVRYQGRYQLLLDNCYRHLLSCLEHQHTLMERSGASCEAAYYEAMHAWYSCAFDDPASQLTRMVTALRNFLNTSAGREGHRHQALVEHLHEVVTRLLAARNHDALDLRLNQSYVVDLSQQAVESQWVERLIAQTIDLAVREQGEPSILFEHAFASYWDLHRRWRVLRNDLYQGQPSTEEIQWLLQDYQLQRRKLFALFHERQVLEWCYKEDIAAIIRLREASEPQPVISCALLNPYFIIDSATQLTVRVENLGGSNAHQFRLQIGRSPSFEQQQVEDLRLETFRTGQSAWLHTAIVPRDAHEVVVPLIYSYSDARGQTYRQDLVLRREARNQPDRRPSHPKTNPFEAGLPVAGQGRFFGRRDLIDLILARLTRGTITPLVLRGPRRIGKSSIQRQTKLLLEDRSEVQRLGLSAQVGGSLKQLIPISVSFQEIQLDAGDYIAQFFGILLGMIRHTIGVTSERQEQMLGLFARRPTAGIFKETLRLILNERPGVRLLILLDEWDEIYREPYWPLGMNLRDVMQDEPRVSWMLASTWVNVRDAQRLGSPWFNLADLMEVGPLDWLAAAELVDQMSRSVGVVWHDQAVVRLLRQTACRPYLVQLTCRRVIDQLILKRSAEVDSQVLETALVQISRGANDTLAYIGSTWGEATPLARAIIWALLHEDRPLQRSEIRSHLIQASERFGVAPLLDTKFEQAFETEIDWLTGIADILGETGEHALYFAVPMVEWWLRSAALQGDESNRLFSQLWGQI